MAFPKKYKIHPAIGIARLGDSDEFFVGPEYSEFPWNRPTPPFKKSGKIKPQAARFRIFEYVNKGGGFEPVREINLTQKDVEKLIWKVHLANRKASFFKFNGLQGYERGVPARRNKATTAAKRKKFEIDPGERTIWGKSVKPVEIKKKNPLKELWPTTIPQINSLGRLATDNSGNLLVIGGRGITSKMSSAKPINDYANNDGWFDDVADGPISVYLKFKGQKPVKVEPSWVICAPPDFAPHLTNIVTLYDLLFDLAARKLKLPGNELVYSKGELKSLKDISDEFKKVGSSILKKYKPSFDKEIYPILKRAVDYAFVFGPAASIHQSIKLMWKELSSNDPKHKSTREFIFNRLRPPKISPSKTFPNMPKLLGDEPYDLGAGVYHQRVRVTVTETQYALLRQWKDGNFISGSGKPPVTMGPLQITPEGLDRAALEACVGAAMYPGIEVSWQIRWPSIFSEPFRIKHGAKSPYPGDKPGYLRAGHFTRQMALPWQADFLMCKKETHSAPFQGDWGWWPAQRPDEVFISVADFKKSTPKNVLWVRSTSGGKPQNWPSGSKIPNYTEMISNWKKFGFIIEDPKHTDYFIESERESNIP